MCVYFARKTFSDQLASFTLTTATSAGLFATILAMAPQVVPSDGAAPAPLVFEAFERDAGPPDQPEPEPKVAERIRERRAQPPAPPPAATPAIERQAPQFAAPDAPTPSSTPPSLGQLPLPQLPQSSASADRETPGKAEAGGAERAGSRDAATAPASASPDAGKAGDAYGGIVFRKVKARQSYAGELARTGTAGTVVVEISISGRGRIVAVSVAAPSGVAGLDRLAVEQARSAGPFPPPPGGRPRVFRIPMTYRPR